jgi:hypothetical protein
MRPRRPRAFRLDASSHRQWVQFAYPPQRISLARSSTQSASQLGQMLAQ